MIFRVMQFHAHADRPIARFGPAGSLSGCRFHTITRIPRAFMKFVVFYLLLSARRHRPTDVAGGSPGVVGHDQTVSVPAHLTWVRGRNPARYSGQRARPYSGRELYPGLHHEGETGASFLCVLPGARSRRREHGCHRISRAKVQHHVSGTGNRSENIGQ